MKGLTPKKPIDGENYQQVKELKEQENPFQNFSSYECLERVDEKKNKNHGHEVKFWNNIENKLVWRLIKSF